MPYHVSSTASNKIRSLSIGAFLFFLVNRKSHFQPCVLISRFVILSFMNILHLLSFSNHLLEFSRALHHPGLHFSVNIIQRRDMILPRISVKIHSPTRIYRAPSQIAGRNRKKDYLKSAAGIFQYLLRHPQYISFKN